MAQQRAPVVPWAITATDVSDIRAAWAVVRLTITGGGPNVPATVYRLEADLRYYAAEPVYNFFGIGAGATTTTFHDYHPPLGRPVAYVLVLDGTYDALLADNPSSYDALPPRFAAYDNMLNYYTASRSVHLGELDLVVEGLVAAVSNTVTVAPLPSGLALLRNALSPLVDREVEPQDEVGVTWDTSTTSYPIVGQSSPTVIGEIRHTHRGTITFLTKSIVARNNLIFFLKDGIPFLLRNDPCAQNQVSDILFYARDVQSARYGRDGFHLVSVDYQSVVFFAGEPAGLWRYQELAAAGNYAAVKAAPGWPDYGDVRDNPLALR